MHRVRIGYLREDSKIETCYVVGNGCIEEMKDKLLTSFNSYERVKALVSHRYYEKIN